MTPIHWIAVWIVGLIVAIGCVLYALRDKDPYNEQDCRATVDRSNGLSDGVAVENTLEPFTDERLAIINKQFEQFNDLVAEAYGEDSQSEKREE